MNLNTTLKTEEKMKKNFPIICINWSLREPKMFIVWLAKIALFWTLESTMAATKF